MSVVRSSRTTWVQRTAVGVVAAVGVLGATQMSASADSTQPEPTAITSEVTVPVADAPSGVDAPDNDDIEADSSSQTTIKTQAEIDAEADVDADVVVKRAKNCDDPILGGERNIKIDNPKYEPHLDARDPAKRDGVACQKNLPSGAPLAPSGPSAPNTPLAPSFTG